MEQEKEMNFEELVKKASEIADARTVVFNSLKKKIEENYLPKLQELLSKCGKESVKIVTNEPLILVKEDYFEGFRTQNGYTEDGYNKEYCIFVKKESIIEGFFDYNRGWLKEKERDYKIKKSGVILFANAIKEKIENLIKIAESEKQAAENALNF